MKPGNKSIWLWLLILIYVPLAPFCFSGHAVFILVERWRPTDYRAKMLGYFLGMALCFAVIAALVMKLRCR
jgi:hypothetical protein